MGQCCLVEAMRRQSSRNLLVEDVVWDIRILNVCRNYQVLRSIDGHFEFVSAPIVTLGDVVQYSGSDWLREPNFGKVSLDKLKKILAKYGLKLKMERW